MSKPDLSKIRTGADFLQACRDSGGQVSDGPLDYTFQKGWAVHPFANKTFPTRAHFWHRTANKEQIGDPKFGDLTYTIVTLCGRRSMETTAVRLLGPGNVTRCAHCELRAGTRVRHKVR